MVEKLVETIRKYGAIVISILALIISVYSNLLKKADSQIGVVDMKKMVSTLSKDLANQYPTGQIPKDKMDKLIRYINIRILMFARKHNKVIFLNKNNMLTSDNYDCTDDVIQAIQRTE